MDIFSLAAFSAATSAIDDIVAASAEIASRTAIPGATDLHRGDSDSPKSYEALGLKTLYGGSDKPESDIVFIHSLFGDSNATWTAPGRSDICWPRDWLCRDLAQHRVMSFGYAGLLTPQTELSVQTLGQLLLAALANCREGIDNTQRPLILVAHGLGGLIAKYALVAAEDKVHHASSVLTGTKAVCFFSTPSVDYSDESWDQAMDYQRNLIYSLPSGIVRNISPTFRLLHADRGLQRLSARFKDLLRDHWIMVASFFETSPTMTVRGEQIVVTQRLAQIGMSQEQMFDSEGDHITCVKFKARTSMSYRRFVQFIRDAVSRTPPKSLLDIQLPWTGTLASVSQTLPDTKTILEKEDSFLRRLKTTWLEASAISDPYANTCDWILTNENFVDWKTNPKAARLAIAGPPGYGKTVLAKFLCGQLQANDIPADETFQGVEQPIPRQYLIQYFFDETFAERRTFNTFLRSVLYQLLIMNRRFFKHLYSRSRLFDDFEFATSDLEDVLYTIFYYIGRDAVVKTILLVDAVDECNCSDKEHLEAWLDKRECKIITAQTGPVSLAIPHQILLESRNSKVSLQRYVDMKLGEVSRWTPMPASIRSLALTKSDGQQNFLWARMIVRRLGSERTVHGCRKVLVHAPNSFDDALLQHLQSFRGDRPLLTRSLYLTSNAFSPLSPLGLAYLNMRVFKDWATPTVSSWTDDVGREIDYEGEAEVADEIRDEDEEGEVEGNFRLERIMNQIVWDFEADLKNFEPVLEVREGRVALIHVSVRRILKTQMAFGQVGPYLGSPKRHHSKSQDLCERTRATEELLHLGMAIASLEYMLAIFEDSKQTESGTANILKKAQSETPMRDRLSFFQYAVVHWNDHILRAGTRLSTNKRLSELLNELFSLEKDVYKRWTAELLHSEFTGVRQWPEDKLRGEPTVWRLSNYCALDLCRIFPTTESLEWSQTLFLDLLGLAAANSSINSIDWLMEQQDAMEPLHPIFSASSDWLMESPVLAAVEHGQLKSLMCLLKHFESRGVELHFGPSLHEATRAGGHKEVFRFLWDPQSQPVNMSLDLPKWNRASFVPLQDVAKTLSALETAVALHHHKALEFLIDHLIKHLGKGDDATIELLEKKSILIRAIEANDAEAVWLLLGKGVCPGTDNGNNQPIHVAARLGYEGIIDILLGHKADVNAVVDETNTTALHLACKGGFASVCGKLLEAGAAVNRRNREGYSAAHFAATSGDDTVMALLVEYGANINARNTAKETPLHLAVQREHEYIDVAEYLLEMGSNMSLPNSEGETPLHVAVQSGNPRLVQLLLEHGAIVDAKDNFFRTPLHLAAEGVSSLICKDLLQAGAFVNDHDKENKTPVDYWWLSDRRTAAVLEVLTEAGGEKTIGMTNQEEVLDQDWVQA